MLDKPSRRMWIAAITVAVVCVAGLAYAFIAEWNTEPDSTVAPAERQATGGSGFTLGLVVGIGAGVVLGSLIALRKRD